MTSAREGQTVSHDGGEVDRRGAGVPELDPDAARTQDLLDCPGEPIGVLDHDPVELLPLGVIDIPALQGLEVQPDRRHGRLQLVSHGIDEPVVLLVPPESHGREKSC